MVREEGAETGEPGVDALHAAPLVGVGNLPPDPLLLHVHLSTRTMSIRYESWYLYQMVTIRIRVMVLKSDGNKWKTHLHFDVHFGISFLTPRL